MQLLMGMFNSMNEVERLKKENAELRASLSFWIPRAVFPGEHGYRDFVDRLFVNKRDGNDGLMHMAAGLSGEAGEVLDQAKKVWVYNKPLDRENMVEELGDAFYYLTGLMILLGIELKDVIEANMAKLRKRYPEGYSDQAAIERKDKVA